MICLATRTIQHRCWWTLLALLASASDVFAQQPLHARIDHSIAEMPGAPLSPTCTDAEFVRRIYLDLTGAVPNVAAARAFMADPSPTKRTVLVDQLLASPQYVRHMATTFDVMLMERRADKHVKQDEWQKYLFNSFAQNKPWNLLVRELLAADGTDEKIRPAARFYLDRDAEPNLLTRDIARLFFGMDLGCCQCHDHPLVDTFYQSDYYGLFAFVHRGTLFTDKDKKAYYAEVAEGDAKFTSVFTKQQDETRPRLPGEFELEEPAFVRGDEYVVAPADKVRPIPKYSRRARLAELATTGSNRPFNRNIANRLWALMMGRGLVEPLDMMHLDNPPTHPELLEQLADEIVVMKFDMRAFLRELALTQTYQRSLQLPTDLTSPVQLAAQQLPTLETTAQQFTATIQQTTEAVKKPRDDYDTARKVVSTIVAELAAANTTVSGALKSATDTAKALTEAEQQLAAKRDVAGVVQEAATKAADVAAKLAGDVEIAAAADKFKSRATQLATEVTIAEKVVGERAPPAKTAADALTAAKSAVTQAIAKYTAAQQQAVAVRQPLAAMQDKLRAEQRALLSAKTRAEHAKSVATLGQVVSAAETARQQIAALQTQLETGKQTLTTLTAQVPQLESAMAASKAASDESAKLFAEAQKQFADRQQTAQIVADALAKAEVAVQKLPQDAELKQAAETVKSRRDKLVPEVAEMQKAMPAREQSAKAAADQFTIATQAYTAAKAQLESLQKTLPILELQLPEAQTKLAAEQTAAQSALTAATQRWSQQFFTASLKPLTPEQIHWSILAVTGVADGTRAAAEAEVNKTMPLDPNAPVDPAKVAERERRIEQEVYDKLKGSVATFTGLFGHAAGQPQRDFFATVDQALYFANAGVLQSWLNPGGENLVGRLSKLTEPRAVADELYLSVLVRPATEEEVTAVTNYLQTRANDRVVALQEMAWALITSNEFRFSH